MTTLPTGKTPSHSKGMSLVELLIALAAGLVILGTLTSFFLSQKKTFAKQEDIAEMQQNVRAGMCVMVREMQMAGLDPLMAGGIGIQEADREFIVFSLDKGSDKDGIDNDNNEIMDDYDPGEKNIPNGNSADSNEYITYRIYETTKLGRRSTRNCKNEPLAENIQTLAFRYWNGVGVELPMPVTSPGDIRKVEITLTGRTARPDPDYPLNEGYRIYTMTSQVTPRNLR